VSLSNYIVTLPDGSEGGLDDFYYAIQASEIEITDDGYVLSDGTLLPTNGEPYWGVTEEDLITLMRDYLTKVDSSVSEVSSGGGSRSQVVDTGDGDDPTTSSSDSGNANLYKIVVVGLLLYIIIKK
jgi:hypothetical protein